MRVTTLKIVKQGKTPNQARRFINAVIDKLSEMRSEGCLELFSDLFNKFCTESYEASRIYYLAYLLEEAGLKVEVGYRED